MSIKYEWSEWFLHDGKGCPKEVIGRYVHVERKYAGNCPISKSYTKHQFAVATGESRSWDNMNIHCWSPIIRYRVRRPLVSEWLAETTSDLPVTEDA